MKVLRNQGVEAEGACVQGAPVEGILAEAARSEADLLVTGTRGRHGVARLVLGSVAAQIVRRAGCPVLTVRAAARRADAAPHER